MTDREQLELAAKAAGGLVFVEDFGWIYETSGVRGKWWNPLDDDGDALRLAVKLKLWTHSGMGNHHEHDDPYAATRRAIVRAAAEIGKAM